jgi:hypothetical protein
MILSSIDEPPVVAYMVGWVVSVILADSLVEALVD